MPAMLDDPDSPTIYRTAGSAPFPDPHHPSLPVDVYPRQVTLRDRVTIATVVPFSSQHQVPGSLLAYLSDQLNKEIEMGDTYPMIDTMSVEKFSSYWFQNFGAVMLLGNIEHADDVVEGKNWANECLGSFYIKPNYPGRSSHVCNAGFLVTDAARNRGVGRLMGETYLEWAPRIGYTYSVFNLVYETNVASCRIWDALGFKRIGRVKGAGNLKSYPGQLIDAIVYGRDLGPEGEDFVSEERFDKIKFYLKYGKYPNGADRAEKSRLRSAATHYKLLDNGKLMLKDKEVISDPQRQYEIARNVHVLQHGGINKTTATIAEKFHWVRIKETVSLVIRNCAECKELGKAPIVRGDSVTARRANGGSPGAGATSSPGQGSISAAGRILSLPQATANDFVHSANASVSPQVLNRSLPDPSTSSNQNLQSHPHSQDHLQPTSPHQLRHHHAAPIAQMQDSHLHHHHHHHHHQDIQDDYMPLDPQIMEDVRQHLGNYNQHVVSHHHHHDPSFSSPHHHDHDLDAHDGGSEQHDSDSFQAMLGATGQGNHDGVDHADGDLDMLIDEEEEEEVGGGDSLIVSRGGGEGDVEVDEGINNDAHGVGVGGDNHNARSGNLTVDDDDDDSDTTAIIKEARVAVEEAARAAEEAMRSGDIGKGELFHHRHDERYGSV